MNLTISMNGYYAVSDEVIAREIEGEIVIVPLISGIGDMDDDLYTLNETGKSVWNLLDGKITLKEVITAMYNEYEVSITIIEDEITGLVKDLLDKRLIVEIPTK